MKPVFQTDFTKISGNCYPACLASILEIPLKNVPIFHGDNWCHNYDDWLRDYSKGNLGLSDVSLLSGEVPYIPDGFYAIAAIPSSNFKGILHAVVVQGQRKDNHYLLVVHDPNGNNPKMIETPDFIGISIIVNLKQEINNGYDKTS